MENKLALIPSADEWQLMKQISMAAVASGLILQKNVESAITIALKGRELNIPPMQSFAQISVIQGKPAISSELMLALIYRAFPSARIDFTKSDDKICVMTVARPGEKSSKWSFTMEEANKAGLTSKNSWKQYPAAILRARCISLMARAKFPDALMGMSHTAEELGAEVDEDEGVMTIDAPKSLPLSGPKPDNTPSPKVPPESKAVASQSDSTTRIGSTQLKELDALRKKHVWSIEETRALLADFGFDSGADILQKDFEKISHKIKARPPLESKFNMPWPEDKKTK